MSGVELSCQEVVEILDDYLDGAMPQAERDRLERHLAECEGCVNYLEQLRTTIHLTGRLTDEAVPPATMTALLEAVRAWRQGAGGGRGAAAGSGSGRDAGQGEEFGA